MSDREIPSIKKTLSNLDEQINKFKTQYKGKDEYYELEEIEKRKLEKDKRKQKKLKYRMKIEEEERLLKEKEEERFMEQRERERQEEQRKNNEKSSVSAAWHQRKVNPSYKEETEGAISQLLNENYKLAVKDFFINFNNFQDRTSRASYWWVMLLFVLPIYLLSPFLAFLMPNIVLTQLMLTVPYIILSLPGLALQARRLHDINMSGWWQLLNYTVIGIVYVFYLTCKKGDPVKNRYGTPPEGVINIEDKEVLTKGEEKEEFEDEIKKIEKVEKMYKDKLITDEERKKMRSKILGID